MERSHKDMEDNNNEVWETDKDEYLEFCAENWLDPNSKYAQKLWDERTADGYRWTD